MIEMSFLLGITVSVDPTLTIEIVSALFTLVGNGAFAYYWLNKIRKEG